MDKAHIETCSHKRILDRVCKNRLSKFIMKQKNEIRKMKSKLNFILVYMKCSYCFVYILSVVFLFI